MGALGNALILFCVRVGKGRVMVMDAGKELCVISRFIKVESDSQK